MTLVARTTSRNTVDYLSSTRKCGSLTRNGWFPQNPRGYNLITGCTPPTNRTDKIPLVLNAYANGHPAQQVTSIGLVAHISGRHLPTVRFRTHRVTRHVEGQSTNTVAKATRSAINNTHTWTGLGTYSSFSSNHFAGLLTKAQGSPWHQRRTETSQPIGPGFSC